jgi:hypothetical protein
VPRAPPTSGHGESLRAICLADCPPPRQVGSLFVTTAGSARGSTIGSARGSDAHEVVVGSQKITVPAMLTIYDVARAHSVLRAGCRRIGRKFGATRKFVRRIRTLSFRLAQDFHLNPSAGTPRPRRFAAVPPRHPPPDIRHPSPRASRPIRPTYPDMSARPLVMIVSAGVWSGYKRTDHQR